LQPLGKLAELRSFRPFAMTLVLRQSDIGEQATAAMRAFFEAGEQLVRKRLTQHFELLRGCFVLIHSSLLLHRRFDLFRGMRKVSIEIE